MRVGTSICALFLGGCAEDHPHACGDKFDKTSHQHTPLGSSPCVWGQDVIALSHNSPTAIIPMRVGTRP